MCWWVASKPFRRRVLCHMVAKSSLSMSLWMCHHVFFHVVWHVATRLLSMILHFFSSYFLTPDSSSTPLSFFCSSNPILILVISYFVLIPFIEVFFCFQFSPSITISHMFCSSFWSLIFFPWPFCWSFFAFNFIIQSKFLFFYFFSIWPSFFWFVFSFVTTIFQFNLTLQLKTLIFPQINGFFFIFTLIFI
jgi:hypothetical protein